MTNLLPALAEPSDREAIRFGEHGLDYRQLRKVTAHLAARLDGSRRVAVWAEPRLETCVAVVGALAAGVPVIPINPKSGERELAHIVSNSEPSLVLAPPGIELPPALEPLTPLEIELEAGD
jgi:malonyl-CoA/methylmalonyl-CoA synthetase